jgi:prepilin peptidase CpaA
MTMYQYAAIAVAIGAAVCDLSTRRIPNVLTLGAALAALSVRSYADGWSGAESSLAGWLVGVACFFPFFALGGMGAGDVKLLGALGAWLGPQPAVWVALYGSIAGGVIAIVVAMWSGYLRRALSNVWSLLMFWRVAGVKPVPDLMLSSQNGPRLAYAVPVLAGLMMTVWKQ